MEAISAKRRNTTGIAPSFIVMKTETNDEADKRRRSHWDDFIFLQNDERRHPYQRGQASITGLRLWSGKIIETGRLVGVALARLVCAQHGHVVNGVQVPCGNTRA
jgi:hypothetical protein